MLAEPLVECVEETAATINPTTLALFFRVLGDPTRIRILHLLEDRSRTAGELVAAVDGLQPRVSTHLACLRHCGFVSTERRGREVIYHLELPGIPRLIALAQLTAMPQAEHLSGCTRIGPGWV